MKTEPNDPINPIHNEVMSFNGLTKREYLSGLAMQGMIANIDKTGISEYDKIGEYSIRAADALIAQLNKD